MLLNYCQYLNLKYVCLYCIKCYKICYGCLRNLLRMFKCLRDLIQIDWKPRFCASYLRQVQMGHIHLWFLLLLSLLNLRRCLYKQYCVFVFLGLVISFGGELVALLDVPDSTFVKFRRKVVVFHCSYYWLICIKWFFA